MRLNLPRVTMTKIRTIQMPTDRRLISSFTAPYPSSSKLDRKTPEIGNTLKHTYSKDLGTNNFDLL